MSIKSVILFLGIYLSLANCSNREDFDKIVSNEWVKCKEKANCTIDFAHVMNFEWDTMCFYSGACSLEDINKDLGFELKEFTDIGDRVLFLYRGKLVYQKEWFSNPSEPAVGTIFETDLKKFRVSKLDAKFKINNQGMVYILTKF